MIYFTVLSVVLLALSSNAVLGQQVSLRTLDAKLNNIKADTIMVGEVIARLAVQESQLAKLMRDTTEIMRLNGINATEPAPIRSCSCILARDATDLGRSDFAGMRCLQLARTGWVDRGVIAPNEVVLYGSGNVFVGNLSTTGYTTINIGGQFPATGSLISGLFEMPDGRAYWLTTAGRGWCAVSSSEVSTSPIAIRIDQKNPNGTTTQLALGWVAPQTTGQYIVGSELTETQALNNAFITDYHRNPRSFAQLGVATRSCMLDGQGITYNVSDVSIRTFGCGVTTATIETAPKPML